MRVQTFLERNHFLNIVFPDVSFFRVKKWNGMILHIENKLCNVATSKRPRLSCFFQTVRVAWHWLKNKLVLRNGAASAAANLVRDTDRGVISPLSSTVAEMPLSRVLNKALWQQICSEANKTRLQCLYSVAPSCVWVHIAYNFPHSYCCKQGCIFS